MNSYDNTIKYYELLMYYKNSPYEYEYFDYKNKIILKKVEDKKYKR